MVVALRVAFCEVFPDEGRGPLFRRLFARRDAFETLLCVLLLLLLLLLLLAVRRKPFFIHPGIHPCKRYNGAIKALPIVRASVVIH